MIAADLRRLRQQRRATARPPLYALLHAAFRHAMAPLAGLDADHAGLARAESAMQLDLAALAEGGAFRYFGIRDALDLGRPSITFRLVDQEGGFQLEADPLIAQIFAGGRRGEGWRRTSEITVDDLAG